MDSVVFYKSFFEAIKELKPTEQARVYDAIFSYAFYGTESKLTGICKAVFSLIKPQIDANAKRREHGMLGAEHGSKGGRPKKNNPIGVSENNPIGVLAKTPNVNVNENVNVNANDNVEVVKEKQPPLPPAIILPAKGDEEYIVTQGEYQEMVDLYPQLDVMQQLRSMKGWMNGNKNKLKYKGDIPRFMYGWLNDELKKKNAAPVVERKQENRLGVFGDYKQTSTDDEWDDLTALALREVNYGS